MVSKKRIVLYIISFILLSITATIVILGGKGYYLDLEAKRFKRLGMIFVKSIPKNAAVYIDNKFKKNKTPLNVSIFPGSYEIRIEKDGYIAWQKRVNVESGLVNFIDYIFLIPKERETKPVTTDGIKNFLLSPDYTKVAFTDMKNNVWTADIKTNEQKRLYSQEQDQNVEIKSWSNNGKNLLIVALEKDGGRKYKLVKENETQILRNLPGEIKKIEFISNSDDKFFALVNSNLYFLTKDEALIREDGVLSFAQNQDSLFFAKAMNGKSEIFKAGLDLKTKDKLQTEQSSKINLFPGKKHRLVYTTGKENELFYLENGKKEKINAGVTDVQWAKDDKKISYITPKEIYVYTFESDDSREPKNRITTRLSKDISKSLWFYDFKHLVYKSESEISLTEIDGDNSVTLTSLGATDVFATTKLGEFLIFVEEKDDLLNIKVMKLSE